ncbi:hypothetical protein ACLOJK_015401 [Asimina triloba]
MTKEWDPFHPGGKAFARPTPKKEFHATGMMRVCQCRKLIGARYFKEGYEKYWGHPPTDSPVLSPRDFVGHGTHTLSTAGGRFVRGASLFGHGNGTAKGGSPGARVATYKVCWTKNCFDADTLAGMDAAISDGVDVLSLSLGATHYDYTTDVVAIGTLHALINGIAVVCAGGNAGPATSSVANVAPWILTVAAATTDRVFASTVKLGNNKEYGGASLSGDQILPEKMYPLINAVNAGRSNASAISAQLCAEGTLDPEKVRGKIVVCLRGGIAALRMGFEVRAAGGVGMIVANDDGYWSDIPPEAHYLPATNLPYLDAMKVFSYTDNTQSPVAYIERSTAVDGRKPNPCVASFSSRGPNPISLHILKPDVAAPGVNILAAYSQRVPVTQDPSDTRLVPFNVLSGTSMATPHVAGVVGLLKSLHPHWSPAAIRSAIVTTGFVTTQWSPMTDEAYSYAKATPFARGAGHIRPNRAMDPGLFYDLTTNDYLDWLCAIGYNTTQRLDPFAKYKCPSHPINVLDFNYPSITVPNLINATITIRRKVKNVGPPSTYTATVVPPPGVSVSVRPSMLKFEKTGQEKPFKLVLKLKYHHVLQDFVFGQLKWSDGVHHVRSPISVASHG